MKTINYLMLISLIVASQPAFGMRALKAKQAKVAAEQLEDAKKKQTSSGEGKFCAVNKAKIEDYAQKVFDAQKAAYDGAFSNADRYRQAKGSADSAWNDLAAAAARAPYNVTLAKSNPALVLIYKIKREQLYDAEIQKKFSAQNLQDMKACIDDIKQNYKDRFSIISYITDPNTKKSLVEDLTKYAIGMLDALIRRAVRAGTVGKALQELQDAAELSISYGTLNVPRSIWFTLFPSNLADEIKANDYIKNDSNWDEIRKNYKSGSQALHPDKGGTEAKIKQFNELYEMVEKKRAELIGGDVGGDYKARAENVVNASIDDLYSLFNLSPGDSDDALKSKAAAILLRRQSLAEYYKKAMREAGGGWFSTSEEVVQKAIQIVEAFYSFITDVRMNKKNAQLIYNKELKPLQRFYADNKELIQAGYPWDAPVETKEKGFIAQAKQDALILKAKLLKEYALKQNPTADLRNKISTFDITAAPTGGEEETKTTEEHTPAQIEAITKEISDIDKWASQLIVWYTPVQESLLKADSKQKEEMYNLMKKNVDRLNTLEEKDVKNIDVLKMQIGDIRRRIQPLFFKLKNELKK